MRYVQFSKTLNLAAADADKVVDFPAENLVVENVALWIEPLTTPTNNTLNWKVQMNGQDVAAYVATNNRRPTKVFSEAGPVPSQDTVKLRALLQNIHTGPIVVKVTWVALVRQAFS